jgi:hypothetical protein
MVKTYKITYGSSKAVKEWLHVMSYETVERRVHFRTAENKAVILCGHWMVEEE